MPRGKNMARSRRVFASVLGTNRVAEASHRPSHPKDQKAQLKISEYRKKIEKPLYNATWNCHVLRAQGRSLDNLWFFLEGAF
ncbi:MAG: hypothetical protein VW226_09440 [Rhodospirillaceae bacterium]